MVLLPLGYSFLKELFEDGDRSKDRTLKIFLGTFSL
jgi:hypothetical protein